MILLFKVIAAPILGLELTTPRSGLACSTDWASWVPWYCWWFGFWPFEWVCGSIYYCFNLQFPKDVWRWAYFPMIVGHLYILCVDISFFFLSFLSFFFLRKEKWTQITRLPNLSFQFRNVSFFSLTKMPPSCPLLS